MVSYDGYNLSHLYKQGLRPRIKDPIRPHAVGAIATSNGIGKWAGLKSILLGPLGLEAEVSDYQSVASVLIRAPQACGVGFDNPRLGATWHLGCIGFSIAPSSFLLKLLKLNTCFLYRVYLGNQCDAMER